MTGMLSQRHSSLNVSLVFVQRIASAPGEEQAAARAAQEEADKAVTPLKSLWRVPRLHKHHPH